MVKKLKTKKSKFTMFSPKTSEEQNSDSGKEMKKNNFKKYYIIGGVFVGVIVIMFGVSFGYAKMYQNKVPPKIYLEGVDVGGMNQNELASFIKKINDNIATGLKISVIGPDNVNATVMASTTAQSKPLVSVSEKKVADKIISQENVNLLSADFWYLPWVSLFSPVQYKLPLEIDRDLMIKNLKESLQAFENPPANANIAISQVTSDDQLVYQITPEKSGKVFDYEKILSQIQLDNLHLAPIATEPVSVDPDVTAAEAEKAAAPLANILKKADLALSYSDEQSHFNKKWTVNQKDLISWIELLKNKDNDVVVGLSKNKVVAFLDQNISPFVKLEPQNAIFRMEGDKVVEFKASRVGKTIDDDATYEAVNKSFLDRSNSDSATSTAVQVITKALDPEIKTGDVNNLGITDIIGVGISSFKGSHTNRIKNIARALVRLNGTLIKPDEIFSANRYAGPYTYENGYLPELVIKGKQVIPEVGGGMCQIGTTLFRMAMNSGMDITQRANHSLVVNYYSDPVNGNPGTDATLYDPIHDLKFKNDTGNYLLLQTDIDYTKMELTFTLWGKPDGRSGSYTHPVVLRWLGVGAPEEVFVDTLKPGQRNCQGAYRGAEATFTYTRITPQGEKIDRVFNSYYRSLPQICMVGKDTSTPPPCPEGQLCESPAVLGGALVPPAAGIIDLAP
jgi:vancomycin resistance protein YoaR